jgi:hypothetical protein
MEPHGGIGGATPGAFRPNPASLWVQSSYGPYGPYAPRLCAAITCGPRSRSLSPIFRPPLAGDEATGTRACELTEASCRELSAAALWIEQGAHRITEVGTLGAIPL